MITNLKSELHKNPDDKKRASLYSDLTWYYSSVSVDSALSYGNKAVFLAKRMRDSLLLAQVYSDLGAVHFRNNDFKNSEKSYLDSYGIRKKQRDFKGIAKLNNNLASVYRNLSLYQKSMNMYLEALRYFKSISDAENINVTKGNIGVILKDLKNYKEAEKYLTEATVFFEHTNNENRLCENYLNLGNTFQLENNSEKAIRYYNKANEKCMKIGNTQAVSYISRNLATVYNKKNNDSAKAQNLKISEINRKKFNSNIDLASLDIDKATDLLNSGNKNLAEKKLLQLKSIFEKQNSPEDLLNIYRNLVVVKSNLNQPDSASFYLEKYIEENDKIYKLSVTKQTQELSTKYETAEKEKQLLQQQSEIKTSRIKILIAIILAFLASVIGFLFYRQQRLKNKQQHQEFELKSAMAHIESQNKLQEQRLSISRDLHDNIGAQLTFIISSLENTKFRIPNLEFAVEKRLEKISDFTRNTIVELRDTIWAMNKADFTMEDLSSRIFNFVEHAQSANHQIKFNFSIDENLKNKKFSSVIGVNLYRTIQEAVNNAMKYANANHITINTEKYSEGLKIEIKDDGKGFDVENVDLGNGLLNMKKRMEEIGGNFSVDSEIGKGTSVNVELEKL